MRKVGMMLLVLLSGCLASGCATTLTIGSMTAMVESVPAGMLYWRVDVPNFRVKMTFDLGKTVEFGVKGVKAFVGMLPPG